MMKKRFISILMMVVALTLFFSGAQASKILVPEIYDPQDASDDSLRTELLQWRPDDSPVWVVIHRSTSGAILPSTIASDFITDEEVYLALNRCLERWNKSGMDMEFRDIALYSDFLAGMNPAMPYGPTQVAFDRFNLISFIEPNETVPTGVFTATYRFYFTVDIDLSNYASIPDLGGGVIYNPLTDEIDVDFDNDGIMDISLPREEYKGGTILDTDVIFNSLYEGYALAPQDPNDITPEEQAEYLGRPDIESLMMRALGEMLGLPGIPMSLPVMGDWVEAGQYASSPWQKRELNFADRMLGALHYSEWAPSHKGPASSAKDDPCQDGGGRISGMVLDGRGYYGQSDIYIIPDIPVFVGTPRDDFYIGPDSVYSDRGIIDLVACTYTGINVNIPNGINAPDTILNSEYLFVGLPARDDYAVYIAPSAARSYLEQYRQYLPEIPDYPAEFYGGANPPNPGDGTARDLNTAGDGIIASRFIEVGYNDFGQYTAGVRVGPRLIFGHPFPGTSYSTVRITRDGVTRDFANLGQAFGPILKPMQVNDITNATTGTWLVDNVLEVTQNIEIVNYIGASGNPDMFRVRYTFRNMSIDDPIDVGLRIMMDTLLAERDNAPFVINGEQVRNERLYQGESLPDDYRVLDNLEFPTLQALGVLKHPALSPPSRFITAWWPDAFDSLYDYDAKGTFFSGTGAPTQDSAVVLFWDTQTLQPGQSVVCSTAYGFLRADTIPESGVPHSLTAPTPYDDYDYISEPVSVVAGQETGNIVVITNVAAAPAGYDDDGDDGDDDDDDDDDDDTARLFFLEDVSPKSGGNALPVDELFALGAAAGDIDNDGDLDIVLACGVINDSGPNSLINRILLNDGTGTFEDVTFGEDGNPGTADDRIPYDTAIVGSYHVNLADFNGDGWLDIFVSNFAAGVGGEVGAQNQLYTNIDVTGDGIPDGFFTDETSVRLPGILNSGPYYIVDQTTRSDVGDIDSDGDIDIIVSNQDRFSDGYGSSGIDPAATPPSNLGTLWFSERILINHVNDKNPARRGYYFTDETLGSDLRFGGNTVDELDRVPPLLPDHPQTTPGPGNDETDYSWTSQVVLAPFTSDAALDILVVNQSEIPHQYRYSGYNMLYDNVDVDGDLLPDGYFECINYARDFFITVSSYDSRPQTRQEPLWIGRPSGYPNHGQIPPAQNDRIPGVASNSQGAIVMDLNATGYREIITVQASENAIYFDPVNPGILSHPGASRSLYSIVGGSALEYVTPFTRIIQENRNVPDYVPGISGRRRAIAAADFNLNGALDLYICNDALGGDLGNVNAVPTYNQVLLNDTFGRFSDVTLEVLKTDPDPDISFYAVTADFDNDGDPDVLVCNTGEQNELFVNRVIDAPPNLEDPTDIPLYIDKTPLYLPPYFASASNPPFVYGYANISLNLAVGDLNADGRLDFIVANGGSNTTAGDYTPIYLNRGEPLNQGTCVFTPSASPFPGPCVMQNDYISVFLEPFSQPAYDVLLADFDNDGDLDLFVSNAGSRNRIYFNEDKDVFEINSIPDGNLLGDAFFNERTDISLPEFPANSPKENSRMVAAGDLNNDGLMDIVIANGFQDYGAPNVILLNSRFPGPNSKPGLFYEPDDWCTDTDGNPITIYDDSIQPAVADFDGDGNLDIFFANRQSFISPTGPNFYERSRLLLGDGTGKFRDVTEENLPYILGDIQTAIAGDFDMDGDWTEDLNGNRILDPSEDANYNGVLDWVDSNGDGLHTPDYDLFLCVRGGQNVYLENDGTGKFRDVSTSRLPMGISDSWGADIGDVNRDGYPDIVVANQTLPSERSIQIMLNRGDGVFLDYSYEVPNPVSIKFPEGYYDFNNNSHAVKLLDIDNDGDLDMIVANLGDTNSFPILGSTNYVFVSRLYGDGFNARMIQSVRTPGSPKIATITPPAAYRGTQLLTLRISGSDFKPGCSLSFGEGITVIGEPQIVNPNVIEVTISIAANAPVGGRVVRVINPDGREGESKNGIFRVLTGDFPTPKPKPVKETSAGPSWSVYE